MQIPNGLTFYVPELDWRPRAFSSFNGIVEALYYLIQQHPRLADKYPTDRRGLEDLVDQYNGTLCAQMGWNEYLQQVSGSGSAPKHDAEKQAEVISQLRAAAAKARQTLAAKREQALVAASKPKLNVGVIYCCPTIQPATYLPNVRRFVQTWLAHPPGHDHHLHVMINGDQFPESFQQELSPLEYHWEQCSNTGWDIGAYQRAAATVPCDMMVCLGAHVSFNHENWLARMVDSFTDNGPGLYGAWGVEFPTIHIRTTAFWFPPQLLASYPVYVGSARTSRYQFEHGQDSFTKFAIDNGFPVRMVTMRGIFEPKQWPDNIPSDEDCLLLDRHHTG